VDIDYFLNLTQEGLKLAVYVSAPILILGLIAGLSVSIFQAATQITDASLAFIPKIAAVVIGIALFGHFMLSKLAQFTIRMYTEIGNLGGGG
jgi:flagellar biosynthesis protein FliQ